MASPKLYKLKRWTLGPNAGASFFTCARPGRKDSSVDAVPDQVVQKWARDVCALGPHPAVVSLLGRKPDGTSEYSFYSFFGGFDRPQDHPSKQSVSEWLATAAPYLVLVQHPTIDFQPIPAQTLDAIKVDVRDLLSQRRTLLIVDSGGETRTAQVCKYLEAKEAFPLFG